MGADLVPSWPHDTPERTQPAEGKVVSLALKLLQFNTVRQFLGLILLSATGAAAATSAFQLGVNYSEWLASDKMGLPRQREDISFPAGGTQLATDSFGATYVLTSTATP